MAVSEVSTGVQFVVTRPESSSSVRPAIRGLQSKSLLAALDGVMTPPETAALYDRLGSETINEIRTALSLSWIPLEQHMRLSTEVMEQVGEEPFVDLFQRAFEGALDSAMLRGLFGTLRRLSKHSTHTLLRSGPRVYANLTRDVGSARYERAGETKGLMFLEGWPTQYSTKCWALGTLGCLRAMLEAAHGGGTGASSIKLVECDEATGHVSYEADWS